MEFTYKQAEPSLHKWSNYFVSRSGGEFEKWELISECWIMLESQTVKDVRFLSRRVYYNMIDIIRSKHGRRIHNFRQGKLSRKWRSMQKYSAKYHSIQDYEAQSNELTFDVVSNNDFIEFVTNCLNKRNGLIVYWYFFCNFTQEEIGDRLEISPARISQLLTEIRFLLRDYLQKYYERQLA